MAPRDSSVGSDVSVLSRSEAPAENTAARLSVVTVAWHTGPHLIESVASILAAPGVDELILVNHGNPPEMIQALRAMASDTDKFVLIETGANLGFAKGCNIGARRASGDLVLFLNPDAVLAPGVARQLKRSAGGLDGDLWAIGGRIMNTDGSEQRGGRRGELTPRSALVSFFGLDRLLPGVKNIHLESEPLVENLMPVKVVSGAALMMPRQAFLSLDGFDERYFLHVEDIDLCRQIRERGGSVWFEPRAAIKHYGGTSKSSPFFVETHKGLGFVKYFWKYYPGPLQRLATMALIIPIFAAIWGRAALLRLRDLKNHFAHRRRVARRLRRLKAHRNTPG